MSGNNGVATVTALSSGRAQTGVASAASGPLGSATGGGGNDPHPLIGYVPFEMIATDSVAIWWAVDEDAVAGWELRRLE